MCSNWDSLKEMSSNLEPWRYPHGIEYVLVNSSFLIDKEEFMTARKDLVFSIFMVALSIALAVQSFRFPSDSAFFPRVLSILLLSLSVLLLVRVFRQLPPEDRTDGIRGNAFNLMKSPPILVFGSTVLYVVVIPFLGFLVSTALFLFGSILFLNRRRPVLAAIYGICYAATIYFLFHTVLKVTLPSGWLL